jgi:hypothetical protein
MSQKEEPTGGLSDDLVKHCERCNCDLFHVWVDRGIWYAACESCGREYGLFPLGRFQFVRDPAEEVP